MPALRALGFYQGPVHRELLFGIGMVAGGARLLDGGVRTLPEQVQY